MNKLKFLWRKTLVYFLWQEFWFRYYFKFILPKLNEIEIDALRLDVSQLSPKIRHRLLKVGYEIPEKTLCRDFLSSKDSVLEIGAAIGFLGLFCQKHLGIRNYCLVEANPRTLEILRRNYALNGLVPQAFHFALGPRNGTIELNIDSDFWEHSILDQRDRIEGRKTMDVPALTLTSLLQCIPHEFNTLIIDIEGAEQFIDADQIPRPVHKLIIEFHPRLLGPERMYHLIAQLIRSGFRVAREENNTFMFVRPGRRTESPVRIDFVPTTSSNEPCLMTGAG